MKVVKNVEEIINSTIIKPGSIIYTAGNAAAPQTLLKQIIKDESIKDIDMLSVLLLGDIADLFSPEVCKRVTHRVIFNGPHSREAMNNGNASYQLMHLSDIGRQLKNHIKPNIVFISVSGPDNGDNYSYGTTSYSSKRHQLSVSPHRQHDS